MNNTISEILFNTSLKNKSKKDKITDIKNSCEEALKYLSGEYRFCPYCKEFYRKKSFEFVTRTREENVCVYEDIINSGGNEYEKQMVTRNYRICPKDHWLEVTDILDELDS